MPFAVDKFSPIVAFQIYSVYRLST